MTKPIVKIRDAYVIGVHLYGIPSNHPNPHGLVSNKREVKTSRIIKHHSTRCIETLNTIYHIENWKKESSQCTAPTSIRKVHNQSDDVEDVVAVITAVVDLVADNDRPASTDTDSFTGGGGEFSGAGATGSWSDDNAEDSV